MTRTVIRNKKPNNGRGSYYLILVLRTDIAAARQQIEDDKITPVVGGKAITTEPTLGPNNEPREQAVVYPIRSQQAVEDWLRRLDDGISSRRQSNKLVTARSGRS